MTSSQFLLTYWPMIAFFISGVVSLGLVWSKLSKNVADVKAKVNDLETDMARVEGRVDAVYPVLVMLQTDMASVKTSLDFIKGSISHLTK